jgi:SOS-response transcriptional repressor LexA
MTIESWIGIIVGVITIIAGTALGVQWLVKHYFDEMKSELTPNSGSSIKDQVTRLEQKQLELEKQMTSQHIKLENKIDKLFETFIDYLSNR